MKTLVPPTAHDPSPRSGFTLIELLIVIAIIGVLAALTAAATVGVLSTQKQTNTELTIQTLMGQLEPQWQAVIEQARNEPLPPGVVLMAGGNEQRARVIWIKLRLKQEFPMNFREAKAPWNTAEGPPPFPATPPAAGQQPWFQQYLEAKRSYVRALANVPGSAPPRPSESAAMLLLALQEARKGTTRFNADTLLGAGAVADTDNDGVPELIDAWGTPLAFFRWPFSSAELNQSNPETTGANRVFRDPADPNGLLYDRTWNNWANFSSKQGVYWFEQICHLVHAGTDAATYRPVEHYMNPTIVSAGKNKLLGFVQRNPLHPDPMAIAPGQGPLEADNIYSFRLRLGGRGGS